MRRLAATPLMLLAPLLAVSLTGASPLPPTITYRHLWVDTAGKSHFTLCRFAAFQLKSMSPPAAPQWQDRLGHGATTTIATVQPDRWDGAWHEDPRPQWIIPLSGRWFMQAQDGTRLEMGPGDIALGEDQNTVAATSGPLAGKKGHLAGNVGRGEVKLLVVQLDEAPTVNQPCRFK